MLWKAAVDGVVGLMFFPLELIRQIKKKIDRNVNILKKNRKHSKNYSNNSIITFSVVVAVVLVLYQNLSLSLCLCLCLSLSLSRAHGLCPVGWGCRINRLYLCRGIRTLLLQRVSCIWHKTVMLELWGKQSTSLLVHSDWSGIIW